MGWKSSLRFVGAGLALASLAATPVVGAQDLVSEAEQTAADVAAIDPTDMEVVSADPTGEELVSNQEDLDIEIPLLAADDLTVSNDQGSVEISIPGMTEGILVDSTVVYEDALPSTDVLAQPVDGGVRQVFVLTDTDAVDEIPFSVDSLGEQILLQSNPNGSITISNADGLEIAGINPPWAVDATGRNLPTSYEINGDTVTQNVDTSSAVFPVTADPTICGNKIKSVRYVTDRGPGRTMMVRPTSCGRWWNGEDGFKEAQREGGRSYSGAKYRSMLNQYLCHFDWQSWKDTWNLDEWRPDVGYWSTVWAKCNPS